MKPAFQPINERCTPETISVEARGLELVQRVTGYYNSTDPLVLAARAGITVAYERWPLITVGEYNRRTRMIHVNLAALETDDTGNRWFTPQISECIIVAHELGHFFNEEEPSCAARCDPVFNEAVAHQFAVKLVGTPYSYQEYERRWRSLRGV